MIARRLIESMGLVLLGVVVVVREPWGSWPLSVAPLAVLAMTAISLGSLLMLVGPAFASWQAGRSQPEVSRSFELAVRLRVQRYVLAGMLLALATALLAMASEHERSTRVGVFVLPVGFAIAALVAATWTSVVCVDGPGRRVALHTGPRIGSWSAPFFVRVHAVPEDCQVELRETYRPTSKNGGYHVHEIRLIQPSVSLHEHRDPDVARLRAEDLAKLFSISLVDRTCEADPDRVRTVDQLDVPLATQLRLRGASSSVPPLPIGSRLTRTSEELPWEITTRAPGLRVVDVAVGVLVTPFIFGGCIVAAAVVSAILGTIDGRVVMTSAAALCAVVSWFSVWRMVLRSRCERQVIRIAPTGIAVKRTAPGLHISAQLSSDVIEDIVVTHNRERGAEGMCVIARGDGVSLAFGHDLERVDACWLRDAAIAALAPRGHVYR